MAAPRNLSDSVLVIKGASSGQVLTIPTEMGDLTWTEENSNNPVHARKVIKGHREGRNIACKVSFNIVYEVYLGDSSASETTPVDALKKKGGALAWVSQESWGRYCTDLHFQITSPDVTEMSELCIFRSFMVDTLVPSEDEGFNKIAVTGTLFSDIEPEVTRVWSF